MGRPREEEGPNPAPTRRLVVQLVNIARLPDRHEFLPEPAPDRHCVPELPAASGLTTEIVTIQGQPWNPAAHLHEAFAGLDPLRALRILLTRRKAALICAHLESAVVLLLLRRLFRLRSPIVVWEVPWSPGWRYREFVNRLAVTRADCSVVYSSSQVALVKKTFGDATPVAFVPFCVDLDFYRPARPPQSGYIFSTGLDRGRDFALVLQATQGMSHPVLIKTGALRFDAAAHPNVTLRTERLGHAAFRELYAGAAIVVVATHDTPNACGVTSLMEALAMGRPTIVTDNPALRDYMPRPEAGVVVPIGDRAALRAAILDLLGDPAKAEAMGRKAREFAERHFDPRRHGQAAADLFLGIIAATTAGRARGASE